MSGAFGSPLNGVALSESMRSCVNSGGADHAVGLRSAFANLGIIDVVDLVSYMPSFFGPGGVETAPSPMDEDGRAQSGTKRGLPRDPRVRAPYRWRLVPQRGKGKPAACRRCLATFEQGEARLTLESDFRANASRYYHVCCVPGGFHPCDVIEGLHDAPPAVQQEIRALRAEDAEVDEEDITLPLARAPRTVVEAGARAPPMSMKSTYDLSSDQELDAGEFYVANNERFIFQ